MLYKLSLFLTSRSDISGAERARCKETPPPLREDDPCRVRGATPETTTTTTTPYVYEVFEKVESSSYVCIICV